MEHTLRVELRALARLNADEFRGCSNLAGCICDVRILLFTMEGKNKKLHINNVS